MGSSFTFARIRGIPIGAHWSWLGVFGLVVWSLGDSIFPAGYPGLSTATYYVMGFVTSVLFFGSILLHEIGHAIQALKEDMKIEGITLWLFGGVARFRGMFPSAGAEFRIAIAGPVVSAAIAAAFGAVAFLGTRVDLGPELQGVVDYLWMINVLVVVFNLIPALPLDGGRVLRAYLWHRQEDFTAATVSAARAGKAFGIVLILVGVLEVFTTESEVSGLWFLFLGWFLVQAAQSESSAMQVRALFGDKLVRDVMTLDPQTTAPNRSVSEFLEGAVNDGGHAIYPVVDEGRVVGIATLQRVGEVVSAERDLVPISRVMDPLDSVNVLSPEARVVDVIDELQEEPRRAPVMDDGKLVGIISLSDLVRLLESERALGPVDRPKAKRSGVLIWILVGLIMIGAAGYLYHPPVAVISPGTALDVTGDIEISGVPVDEVNGEYILTAVSITSEPNALKVAWSWLTGSGEVVPNVVPEGIDEDAYFIDQRRIFEESEQIAAAAAAGAVGLDVSITGTGARVEGILSGTPAARRLEPGDVIVAIDDEPIELVTDLQEIVRSRPAGTEFDIRIERAGSERTVRLESVTLPGSEGIVGIGVQVTTRDFDVELPFDVSFKDRDIGGPSAGFVYSLAIADMLDDEDFADGRSIAATGTIDFDGTVGEIGHPDLKAVAAADEGADVFLVPQSQVDEVDNGDLEVIGVDDLERAIDQLEGTA